ncbi:MAG: Tex family protein [Lysobacterales bacterium]
MALPSIESRIATEINAHSAQVLAAIQLLDEGATVPFIARYRKEVTGGLDDTQLRNLEERLGYLRELEERREAVLSSIEEQGKLSDALRAEIVHAETKARLEDLYLPYKPRRRTKAQIAREAGLEPLADALVADPTLRPEDAALAYVNAEQGVADSAAALEGARAILSERFSEDPALVGELREWLYEQGRIHAKVIPGKENEGAKFRDYFDFVDGLTQIPSHRTLALFRARAEGVLDLDLEPVPVKRNDARGGQDEAEAIENGHRRCEGRVAHRAGVSDQGRPADAWLIETCRQTWRYKLHVRMTLDLFSRIRERAEEEAIRIFGDNLKDLLLAPPAGPKAVIGLDPGLRTGVKVAVVDATGKLLATETIYPLQPKNQHEASAAVITRLAETYGARLIAIGNGTGSRETEAFVGELALARPELKLTRIVVSEAGASVYSASELASREFPGVDVSLRGAVSIARRLQDPLAELVKIEPKAIGVGQYQHDVNQVKLGARLDNIVEDCVNAVGVDLNTASAPLLARVSGLSVGTAESVVRYRDEHGAFTSRRKLLEVPRLGPKTFEQAAGFLRIRNSDEPLDASSVHPEAYPVVDRIARHTGLAVAQLIGNGAVLARLDASAFVDERFGLPTVQDILRELEKPGRDPRPEFKTAQFSADVHKISDLVPGMVLEGVVTNVAAFGAFIDIGVHQDGLVHVSELSDRYIKDPREVVKTGQIVKVRVLEVDAPRKRIGLSLKLTTPKDAPAPGERRGAPPSGPAGKPNRGHDRGGQRAKREPDTQKSPAMGTLGDLLSAAMKGKR